MNQDIYYVNAVHNNSGTLHLMKNQLGKCFWQMGEQADTNISEISDHLWTPITTELFDQLVKHPDTIKSRG